MAELDMKVLPCPFCGSKEDPVKRNSRTYHNVGEIYEEVDYYLECDKCSLIIGTDMIYDEYGDKFCDFSTREEAIKFWNDRFLNKRLKLIK